MIGIVGASGAIGGELYKYLMDQGERCLGTYCTGKKENLVKYDLRIDDPSLFDRCDIVVIMGGVTNIDECAKRKEDAQAINVDGIIRLIKHLADKKIESVFISSDQVFNGKQGNYSESDEPDPVNQYGKFKLEVERFMRENLSDYLIFRLSKTYSKRLEWGILAETVASLKRGDKVRAAYNLIYNPTDVMLVCEGIYKAITAGSTGLYHLAGKNIMSRYDFAIAAAKEFALDQTLIEAVDMNKIPLLEKRALNSTLNVRKFFTAFELSTAWV